MLYFTLLYFIAYYKRQQNVMLRNHIFPKLTFRLFMPFLAQNRQKLIYTHNDNKTLCYISHENPSVFTMENQQNPDRFPKIPKPSKCLKIPKNAT